MTAPKDPIRIVIADDHRMFTQALVALFDLESQVNVVGVAHDGTALLERFSDWRPDLAIVDISMPGPGLLAIRAAIADGPHPCPVVALTMHLEVHFAVMLLRSGIAGYVTKDAPFDEILEAVREVGAGHRFVSRQLAQRVAEIDDDSMILTLREMECLRAAADGETNKMIARQLGLSERTVRFHFENICRKLDAPRRGGAIAAARKIGLI